MHEWALAEAILVTAAQVAEREQLREVTEVVVCLGELQDAGSDILEFALNELKSGLFRDAVFCFVRAKAELKCRVCGCGWFFEKSGFDVATVEAIHFVPETVHTFVKCPKCGSPDFEIVSGRGVWLDSIQGVK
jgi:hydrogenase nickel incorporation protein HypA/HybF